MTKFKTYLPLFSGFYNTLFESDNEDNEIEDINNIRESLDKKPITYDDCNFDYKTYQNEISENCCSVIEDKLTEFLGVKCTIEFEVLVSPKFYNFTNDSINCTINVDKKIVLKTLIDNSESFKEYIKDKYTSRSGFMSFYSNDADDWIDDFKKDDFDDEHKIGSILEFVLLTNDYKDEDLYFDCMDLEYVGIYATNYEELTT